MAPAASSAHPVQTLREHVTALEASITLALADPEPRPIHQLRTSTRRIEAQLALLSMLPATPLHTGKIAKHLKQLRRAAGKVRDLDVQRDLLSNPHQLQVEARAQDRDQNRTQAQPAPTPIAPPADLARDAKSLRKMLKHRRSAAARDLMHILRRQQPALTRALETLFQSLDKQPSKPLPASRLATLTRTWYRDQLPADSGRLKASTDHLHTIRKVAKLARYMAESNRSTQGLAHIFEDLQQAGGTWHDYLQLRDLARAELGKRSPLPRLLDHLTRLALDRYQTRRASLSHEIEL